MAKKVLIYALVDGKGKIYLRATQREVMELVNNVLSSGHESMRVERHPVYLDEEKQDET